jgi:hypothetical protein
MASQITNDSAWNILRHWVSEPLIRPLTYPSYQHMP